MPQFRYQLDGSWFKGNTHIHSTASDGGKTSIELAEMYSAAGYDFLFHTDHWVCSDVTADTTRYPLLRLDGIELDGKDSSGSYYHVVALGTFQGLHREMGMEQAMQSARQQGGLLILAHPLWTNNTFEEAQRWHFDGIEVYNHVCQWLNGKGNGLAYWNNVLGRFPGTLGLAVDDAHIGPSDPGWNGGWLMVNAPELSRQAILSALRSGNFYSTCGPLIDSLELAGETIRVQCSPVQFARLVGPGWRGQRIGAFDGSLLTEAAFSIPQDWDYAYLELEDSQGRRAWTNPLWVEQAKTG